MPHKIGKVTDGAGLLAHQNMLQVIIDLAVLAGWEVMRSIDVGDRKEVILKSRGFSGDEEIYVGFQTYQDANADYYNLLVAAFTGYVTGNTFKTQPGYMGSGVPAHNRSIDYWLTINAQRIVLAMKMGTPVYESLYVGKMNPYARPTQYPYPVICAGMLNGDAAKRFSDEYYYSWFKGNIDNMRLYFNSGEWVKPLCYPFSDKNVANDVRDTEGAHALMQVTLYSNVSGVFGELDGVFFVTGFDNVSENILTIEGQDCVVIQDVARTSFADHIAIRMDD